MHIHYQQKSKTKTTTALALLGLVAVATLAAMATPLSIGAAFHGDSHHAGFKLKKGGLLPLKGIKIHDQH